MAGCKEKPHTVVVDDVNVTNDTEPMPAQIANPASVNCIQKGYVLKIMTDDSQDQYGLCIFPDETACEEWAFFREECDESSTNRVQIET